MSGSYAMALEMTAKMTRYVTKAAISCNGEEWRSSYRSRRLKLL
ncbi:hypothetical protein OIU74_007742 [Salix koriyanagi]|uniref:Uncharacterized protein n=1 Tax=Salix koriyanagi TaxID=2511006 RepID=A0A9Q0U4F6_9ROSI|nr:hypothetical protein OIU74_007742 [Salix koriyanagi]